MTFFSKFHVVMTFRVDDMFDPLFLDFNIPPSRRIVITQQPFNHYSSQSFTHFFQTTTWKFEQLKARPTFPITGQPIFEQNNQARFPMPFQNTSGNMGNRGRFLITQRSREQIGKEVSQCIKYEIDKFPTNKMPIAKTLVR